MNIFSLDDFDGSGDGIKDNSPAFLRAFSALKESGGGTLKVPAGVWRTGPIELFSRTTLLLEEGAVISFFPEPHRYTPVFTRWESVECYGMRPLVFASGQTDIRVSGKGAFDGCGEFWWNARLQKKLSRQSAPETAEELQLAGLNDGYQTQGGGGGGREIQFLRPPLMQFYRCSRVTLEDFSLRNSPFWTLHPVYCDTVNIRSVSIVNPPDSPNTDGIDIDSCRNVVIEDCALSVGDDAIALKSGSGEDGLRVNKATCHVRIRNCSVQNAHGGVVIGSETAGGVYDVIAEDCVFTGADRGIRIKTRRGRGGEIRDLVFKNLVMKDNLCPLAINMYYRCGAEDDAKLFSLEKQAVNRVTPSIKNISIANITARGCRASAGFIAGLPEMPVTGLSVRDSVFSTDETSAASAGESDMFQGLPAVTGKGFRLLNVINPEFSNVVIEGPAEAFIYR
jgi:polygalacturonase